MEHKRSTGAILLAQRLQTLIGQVVPSPALARTALRATGEEQSHLRPLPEYIEHALGRMSLLYGVPFRYLVPDSRLLPSESIRFFTLDPDWLDLLTRGALAVGGGSRELALARRVLPQARLGAIKNIPFVRSVSRGVVVLETLNSMILSPQDSSRIPTGEANEVIISGFLLRSELVLSWPGLSVRAWTSDDEAVIEPYADPAQLEQDHPELVVPVLRLERLAPTVLLALFHGTPRMVWLEEPHQSVQFGLNRNHAGWEIDLRDEQGMIIAGQTVPVPMRDSPLGVVDVTSLVQAINQRRPLAQSRGSAALALQLLQSPARQRFTASAAEHPDN